MFDSLSGAILSRFGRDGRNGAVFTDPYAAEAYLFHLALIAVEQGSPTAPQLLESRLIGLRQLSDGTLEECPVEHLLLLRGAHGFAPSRVPLATLARGMVIDAARFIREEVSERVAQAHRQRICPPAWSSSIAASTFRLPNSPPPNPTSATWPALTVRTPRGSSPRSRNGSGAYWLPATGHVEMSENEWAKACNLRDEYWLYIVFDCATPHPRLVRVRDPFAKLLVRSRESIAYTIASEAVIEAAE